MPKTSNLERDKKWWLVPVRQDKGTRGLVEAGQRPAQKVLVLVCCVQGPAGKDSHGLDPLTPRQTHKPLHLPQQHNSSIEGGS